MPQIYPQNCPSSSTIASRHPSNTPIPRPTPLTTSNGIWIQSAVFDNTLSGFPPTCHWTWLLTLAIEIDLSNIEINHRTSKPNSYRSKVICSIHACSCRPDAHTDNRLLCLAGPQSGRYNGHIKTSVHETLLPYQKSLIPPYGLSDAFSSDDSETNSIYLKATGLKQFNYWSVYTDDWAMHATERWESPPTSCSSLIACGVRRK